MLGTAWLTLRQARAALQNGRLDEARELLNRPDVRGHKRSWTILEQLANSYLERAERKLKANDAPGAWDDVQTAEKVAPAVASAHPLRGNLQLNGLIEARAALDGGDPRRAIDAITRLKDRHVPVAEWQRFEDAAKDWLLTQDLADRGELAMAVQMFERVRRVLPESTGVERYDAELKQRSDVYTAISPELHEAVDQKRWRDVLTLADRVLAVAPQHAEARKARTKAWRSNEPETICGEREPTEPSPEPAGPPKRYLLWIDNVGGYLICLSPRVTIGQAGVDAGVDVPLLADVSRTHAAMTRDAEGYVVEATRPLQVNGQLASRANLNPGDRITLGAGCQLEFCKPVPLSATARIDLGGRQRLPLSLDSVILMADTLILGASSQSHVVCPDLNKPIVLFRDKDGLAIRAHGEFTINGVKVTDREKLPATATVSGADFNLCIEPAGRKLGQRVPGM